MLPMGSNVGHTCLHTDVPAPILGPMRNTEAISIKNPKKMLILVSIFLGFVTLAPLVISGQDLYHWAQSPTGLNLHNVIFALLIPVVFDIAASACIGMEIIGSVWRRERAGIFGLMKWVFAGASAYAQYRSGVTSRENGVALDAYWAFPLIAILGPSLLHITLNKIRKWGKEDTGEIKGGAAGFGTRWIPGVAFLETLQAWAASHREGIQEWRAAVTYVQERKALQRLATKEGHWPTYQYCSNTAVLSYAHDAQPGATNYQLRQWLAARKIQVATIGIVKAESNEPEPIEIVEVETNEPEPAEATTEVTEEITEVIQRHTIRRSNARFELTPDLMEKLKDEYPNWQTIMPSIRNLRDLVGAGSLTTGKKIQTALQNHLLQLEDNSDEPTTVQEA